MKEEIKVAFDAKLQTEREKLVFNSPAFGEGYFELAQGTFAKALTHFCLTALNQGPHYQEAAQLYAAFIILMQNEYLKGLEKVLKRLNEEKLSSLQQNSSDQYDSGTIALKETKEHLWKAALHGNKIAHELAFQLEWMEKKEVKTTTEIPKLSESRTIEEKHAQAESYMNQACLLIKKSQRSIKSGTIQKLIGLWEKAAELNYAPALLQLGHHYLIHGDRRGINYLQRAAQLDHIHAHIYLGECHEFGIEVKPDRSKAIEHYLIAIRYVNISEDSRNRCLVNLQRCYMRPELASKFQGTVIYECYKTLEIPTHITQEVLSAIHATYPAHSFLLPGGKANPNAFTYPKPEGSLGKSDNINSYVQLGK